MKDNLGDRIKEQYENRSRVYLPRRTYTIIRLDGKAFHTFTRGCNKPFDNNLINCMTLSALEVFKEAQGAQIGYIQSDEASILLTDFREPNTEAWFNGNIQKICSVSASIMTATFNNLWSNSSKTAYFDCRVFTIPDYIEVENYFIWRQKDWIRNSLQMLARAHFSHKELNKKCQNDMHEMLHSKGINWADLDLHLKNGMLIESANEKPAFHFTKEREKLTALIPKHWEQLTNKEAKDG